VKKKETIEKKPEPPTLYINMDSEDVSLDNYKGKRILLNFWATWCTPCLQEMPSLVRAQEILQDENYVFLFPTTDEISKIKAFNNSKNYPFKFLHLTSTLDQLNIYALPATFIYNKDGEMVKRIDGATEWDSEEIINLLKTIQ
jgi:thiol-disulfide isomerase/thioredoxin